MSDNLFNNLEDFAKALSSQGEYTPEENILENEDQDTMKNNQHVVRVHLIKKNKSGKPVSIIRGIKHNPQYLKDLASELKKSCGVGGNYKEGEIIIQGDRRDQIIEILKKKGFTNIKKAGS